MRKNVAFFVICIIFAQCVSFSGCRSKKVIEENMPSTIALEPSVEVTEIATEIVIDEGDSLDQYTISPTITTERTEKIVEETTVPNGNSYTETYSFSEPTEDMAEDNTQNFIPGENETPGDPL